MLFPPPVGTAPLVLEDSRRLEDRLLIVRQTSSHFFRLEWGRLLRIDGLSWRGSDRIRQIE
jgi:hypothetical protein